MSGLTSADYASLVLYVLFTVIIGLLSSKQKDATDDADSVLDQEAQDAKDEAEAEDLFLAGRDSNPWITAISLVSGLTSGISFLGAPGFSYTHGTAAYFIALASLSGTPIVVYALIPFFQVGFSA